MKSVFCPFFFSFLCWNICNSQYNPQLFYNQNFPLAENNWMAPYADPIPYNNPSSLNPYTFQQRRLSYDEYNMMKPYKPPKNVYTGMPVPSPANNFRQFSPRWRLYQQPRWWEILGVPTAPRVYPAVSSNFRLKQNRKFFYTQLQKNEIHKDQSKMTELQSLIESNIDKVNTKLEAATHGFNNEALLPEQMDQIVDLYDKVGQELIHAYVNIFDQGFRPFIKSAIRSFLNKIRSTQKDVKPAESVVDDSNNKVESSRRLLDSENLKSEVGPRALWVNGTQPKA